MEALDQGVVVVGAGPVGLLDAAQLGDALAAAHAGAAEEPPVQFRHVISAMNDSEEDA